LTQDDTVKLLDFGIALAEDGMDLTGTGMILGTFVYSSPEQNQGRILDERSDLYALGCVFFEMLTGQRALPGSSMTEIAKFQALPQLALPSHFNPKVPPELDAIVSKLLKPRSRDRYQDAGALLADLDELKASGQEDTAGQVLFGGEVAEAWEHAKEAFSLKEIDRAIEHAAYYIAQRPEDAKAHFLLGKLYAEKRLPFNATESFGQALELSPKNDDYRLDFALALFRLEMFKQCLDQVGLIRERDEKHVGACGLEYLARQRSSSERVAVAAPTTPPVFGGASAETPPAFGGTSSKTPPAVPVEDNLAQSGDEQNKEYRRFVQEKSSARGSLRQANRARLAGTFFPGLGHLYGGMYGAFVAKGSLGVLYVGALSALVFISIYSPTLAIEEGLVYIARPLADLARALSLEYLLNAYRDVLAPVLAFLVGILLARHWWKARKDAYLSILKTSLRGKVLVVRDADTLKLNIGALRGVELGQRFTVLKGIAAKEYQADVEETVSKKQSWHPVAKAKVINVRSNTCVVAFRMLSGITVQPQAGDRVEPIL